MLLSDVKRAIEKGMERSYKIPDDGVLEQKIYEAILFVASQCVPQVLLRYEDGEGEPVFRKLPNKFFITLPEYPELSQVERHLMIDETLSFAVVNTVCFLLSGEEKFNLIANRWIFLYQKNDLTAWGMEEIDD